MPLCPQITITPVTVTSTGMTTSNVIPNVFVNTEELDSVATSVNGKTKTYRQTTPPTGTDINDGDLWFDTDDGNKLYMRVSGAWVSVQDTAIAAATAASAAAAAAAAAADEAAAAADAAAVAAQTTANGKNRIYRQTTMPTGGTYAEGDLWFDTDDDNKFYRYTSGTFSPFTLGDGALASISANKLTAGTIDASVITVSNLDAGRITTGYLAAARIEVASLSGDKITSRTIDAVKIKAASISAVEIAVRTITAAEIATGTITANEIAVETITAAEIEAGSITVDRLTAGTLTAFTLQTSTGARRVTISASTNSIAFREASTNVGFIGPTSIDGVIMHYGTSFNPAATSYPHAFVSSGSAQIAYSSGIYCEVSSTGVVMNGNVYTLDAFYNQDASTSGNAANTRMDTDGRTRRSTASSARFKEEIANISTVADLDPSKLLSIPIRAFKFKSDYLDPTDNRAGMVVPGLIAEEVAEHYPIAADRDNDGVVENWNERFVIPGMLALIQDLHGRVATLEGKP
jgi:hypothetical protein